VLFPEYPQKLIDSTSGAASPDLEIFCTPMAYKVRLHARVPAPR
jgi:hypothetical protein